MGLVKFRLRDETPYEALSYTWATENGDSVRSSQLKCHGQSIWVTKNCEAALRRLRHSDSERILWVDAICINQDDEKERGHQVQPMQDIYTKATQVLIWLGTESEMIGEKTKLPVSDIFLEHFSRMATEIRELEVAGRDGLSSALYQELKSEVRNADSPLSKGLIDVVHRRWWGRVWVVQEVAVAKKALLICAEKTASYYEFHHWQNLVFGDKTAEAYQIWALFDRADDQKSLIQLTRQDPNLYDQFFIISVLRWVGMLEASDPRDKIFGMLGLLGSLKSVLPSPDYSRSPAEVFTDVTKSLLAYTKSLDILDVVSAQSLTSDFPSWVKDWSTLSVLNFPHSSRRKYDASRYSEPIYTISDDNKELKAKGRAVDSLDRISLANLAAYGYAASFTERYPGYATSCREGSSLDTYPTGAAVREALWRTLCWNTDAHWQYPASEEVEKSFLEWYNIIMSDKDLKSKEVAHNALENPFSNLTVPSALLGLTEKGFLAAVPYTAQVGDHIVVLAGGQAPFVLRRIESYYRLIGPCYVHGIMDGEAFPDDPTELQWFSIR
jgi:hypothetical protein